MSAPIQDDLPSQDDLLERIERLFVRERLFREEYERRIKIELSEEIENKLRLLMLRQPITMDPRTKTMIHTVDGHRLILDMRESFMALHLIEHGCWEESLRAVLRRILPPGGVFLDIGANIGVHALLGAMLVGKGGLVIAVEPSPHAREILRENFEINGIFHNLRLLDVAVADAPGENVVFEWFPQHPAMSSFRLTSERVAEFVGTPERLLVRTQTIDAIIAESGRKPDLVKIDIEGFELQAFRGAARALSDVNMAWVIEYEPRVMRASLGDHAPDALWDLIALAGLKARPVNENIDGPPLTHEQFKLWEGGDLLLLHPGGGPHARMFGAA